LLSIGKWQLDCLLLVCELAYKVYLLLSKSSLPSHIFELADAYTLDTMRISWLAFLNLLGTITLIVTSSINQVVAREQEWVGVHSQNSPANVRWLAIYHIASRWFCWHWCSLLHRLSFQFCLHSLMRGWTFRTDLLKREILLSRFDWNFFHVYFLLVSLTLLLWSSASH